MYIANGRAQTYMPFAARKKAAEIENTDGPTRFSVSFRLGVMKSLKYLQDQGLGTTQNAIIADAIRLYAKVMQSLNDYADQNSRLAIIDCQKGKVLAEFAGYSATV